MCSDEQHLKEMNDGADGPLESITGTSAIHTGGGPWAQEKMLSVLQAGGTSKPRAACPA